MAILTRRPKMRPPVAPTASAGTNMPVEAPTPFVQIISRYVSLDDMRCSAAVAGTVADWPRRLPTVWLPPQSWQDDSSRMAQTNMSARRHQATGPSPGCCVFIKVMKLDGEMQLCAGAGRDRAFVQGTDAGGVSDQGCQAAQACRKAGELGSESSCALASREVVGIREAGAGAHRKKETRTPKSK